MEGHELKTLGPAEPTQTVCKVKGAMPPYTFSLTEVFMSLCLILLLSGKGKLLEHAFADCQFI